MKARFDMTVKVTWNRDMVPGFNYEVEDFQRLLKQFVEQTLVSYEPEFEIVDNGLSWNKKRQRMSVAREFFRKEDPEVFIDGEPPIVSASNPIFSGKEA